MRQEEKEKTMNILLSIRPEYVDKILSGEKRWEFRKTWPDNVERVYIYCTSPAKKIVGYFTPGTILYCEVPSEFSTVWSVCGKAAGISEEELKKYYGDRGGCAVAITDLYKYNQPFDPYSSFEKFRPPQNYYYIDSSNYLIRALNQKTASRVAATLNLDWMVQTPQLLKEVLECNNMDGVMQKPFIILMQN
jgi:type I restriction enzyme S subunit